jgi:hypothetical protein
MMAIAYQIFEQPQLQEGVGRSQLEDMATKYLLGAKYEKEERARRVAARFIEFCTGRAWVFTNTGSNEAEELYQFTHRTFLEYFAAANLTRTKKTTEGVLSILLPHISLAEWDVVSQLAIQIIARQFEGGSDEVVIRLLEYQRGASGQVRCNVLSFGVRCLSFLVPRESRVRDLISALLDTAFSVELFPGIGAVSLEAPKITMSPRDLLMNVLQVAPENEEACFDALRDGFKAAISGGNALAVELCVAGVRVHDRLVRA